MQKHVNLVNLVELVKSFPTHIFLQNLASIQKRTSPRKVGHLAEKLDDGSTSNLSTKAEAAKYAEGVAKACERPGLAAVGVPLRDRLSSASAGQTLSRGETVTL